MQNEEILWENDKNKIIESPDGLIIIKNNHNEFKLSSPPDENCMYINYNCFCFCDNDSIDISFLAKNLKNKDFNPIFIHGKKYTISEFCDYVWNVWAKQRSSIKQENVQETGYKSAYKKD